jgi:hypothetical protein
VSLLVTQGYASDLASPSFSCLPSGYILFVPAPGAGKKVLLLSSSPLVLVCCVARSLTPYIPSSCLKTFQKLTRPPLIERKVTSLRSQSHAILYKQTRHLNIRPKNQKHHAILNRSHPGRRQPGRRPIHQHHNFQRSNLVRHRYQPIRLRPGH